MQTYQNDTDYASKSYQITTYYACRSTIMQLKISNANEYAKSNPIWEKVVILLSIAVKKDAVVPLKRDCA